MQVGGVGDINVSATLAVSLTLNFIYFKTFKIVVAGKQEIGLFHPQECHGRERSGA